TGTVTFFDGTTALGTTPMDSNGKATLAISSLNVGAHSITATYNGSTNFAASTSAPLNQVVQKAGTNTTVSSSPNPSVFGSQVTLTAMVTSAGGAPTGIVALFDGTTALGTASLDSNGKATLLISTLNAGPHSITATY